MASVPQIGAREKMLPVEPKIEAFLSELAVEGNEAVSRQNQAFNALLFVYREVLGVVVGKIESMGAAGPARVPRGLPPEEARQVIVGVSGTPQLVVKLETWRSCRSLRCLRLRTVFEPITSLPTGPSSFVIPLLPRFGL